MNAFPLAALALDIHVSPKGADEAPGTAEAPVQSLPRALELSRTTRTRGEQRIRILVHEGTYYLDATLQLTKADSGLIIEGMAGEDRPIISGGVPIPAENWKREAPDSPLWKTPWPAELSKTPKYIYGAYLARTPNRGDGSGGPKSWFYTEKRPFKGEFGDMLGGVHTAGDWLEWQVTVPQSGAYKIWFLYSADNQGMDTETAKERLSLGQVDGEKALLSPADTGDWGKRAWHELGTLKLDAGYRTLRWENLKGWGLGFDAIALSTDANWKPDTLDQAPSPPGGNAGYLLIQAENFSRQAVKELATPGVKRESATDHFTFRGRDLPDAGFPLSPEPRIHMFPAWGWVNTIVGLDRIDATRREAWIKPGRAADQEVWAGNRYFIANIREGLDEPGEWWPDPVAREILYFPGVPEPGSSRMLIPPGSAKPQNLVVAKLDRLITITGADDIRILGLEFRDTDYSLDISVYVPSDAAISLDAGSERCVIENNRFIGLGGYAVQLTQAAANNEIVGNEMGRLGQGGVILQNWETGQQPVDNLIAGNYMHDLGGIYKHVAGVYCTTAHRTTIAHNHIERVPRYGISFKSYHENNGSHGNIAEYNWIESANLETNDSGIIETLGRDKRDSGNIIRYNRLLHAGGLKTTEEGKFVFPHMGWGVYLDDYSSGTEVRGNSIGWNDIGAVNIHGGRNNVIEGNGMTGSIEQVIHLNPIDGFSANNRVIGNWIEQKNEGTKFIQLDRFTDHFKRIISESNRNYFSLILGVTAETPGLTPLGSLTQWRAAGMDTESVILGIEKQDPPKLDLREDKVGLQGYPRAWKEK